MVARAKEEGPGTDDKQEGETSTKVHLRFPLREEAVKLVSERVWARPTGLLRKPVRFC